MKLSVWAKKNGISYKTAHRLFRAGELPVPVTQLATGTILVHEEQEELPTKAVLYARVSSHDQKADLERQMDRLRSFASQRGLVIQQEIKEIASGLNSNRKKLNKILKDRSISPIVVEHRDSLARFGVNMLEASLEASNRSILVMNETEHKDDLVQDFIDVVTSMCARIYGKRSATNRAAAQRGLPTIGGLLRSTKHWITKKRHPVLSIYIEY